MDFEIIYWILLIVSVLFALIVDYAIAWQFYESACYKGFNNRKYLWLCFLFGMVGYLLVISLPNRNGTAAVSNIVSDELPDL